MIKHGVRCESWAVKGSRAPARIDGRARSRYPLRVPRTYSEEGYRTPRQFCLTAALSHPWPNRPSPGRFHGFVGAVKEWVHQYPGPEWSSRRRKRRCRLVLGTLSHLREKSGHNVKDTGIGGDGTLKRSRSAAHQRVAPTASVAVKHACLERWRAD